MSGVPFTLAGMTCPADDGQPLIASAGRLHRPVGTAEASARAVSGQTVYGASIGRRTGDPPAAISGDRCSTCPLVGVLSLGTMATARPDDRVDKRRSAQPAAIAAAAAAAQAPSRQPWHAPVYAWTSDVRCRTVRTATNIPLNTHGTMRDRCVHAAMRQPHPVVEAGIDMLTVQHTIEFSLHGRTCCTRVAAMHAMMQSADRDFTVHIKARQSEDTSAY
jgi:hypothetical protein